MNKCILEIIGTFFHLHIPRSIEFMKYKFQYFLFAIVDVTKLTKFDIKMTSYNIITQAN